MRATAHAAHESAALALVRHGLALLNVRRPSVVSGFHPHETEIDCLPLLAALESTGWRIALPVVVAKGEPLEFREWQVGGPLESGVWDIPVPPAANAAVTPEVLLIPLLAFDEDGYRLGYGGGFYDRTLARLRAAGPVVAVGVGYAAQKVAACPRQAFDQRLDAILTEDGPTPIHNDNEEG